MDNQLIILDPSVHVYEKVSSLNFIFKILLKQKHFNQHFAYQILIQMAFIEIFYQIFYFQNCLMMVLNMDFGRIIGVV